MAPDGVLPLSRSSLDPLAILEREPCRHAMPYILMHPVQAIASRDSKAKQSTHADAHCPGAHVPPSHSSVTVETAGTRYGPSGHRICNTRHNSVLLLFSIYIATILHLILTSYTPLHPNLLSR
jgi:hypothetical protein